MKVVIVGAGAAGFGTASSLRRLGFDGDIALVATEPELPYDRPPLSKDVLTSAEPVLPELAARAAIDELALDLRIGEARELDVDHRTVRVGEDRLAFDHLVIATGVRSRRLLSLDGDGHVVRSWRDALALRDAARRDEEFVVVGGSVLGTEIAASLAKLGRRVTVVALEQELLELSVGPAVGAMVSQLHRDNGVRVMTGERVQSLARREGRPIGVELTHRVVTGVLVEAVGSLPNVEWLAGSGLPVDGGVLADEHLRVADRVWAAGDVCSWLDRDGVRRRRENRTNAAEQGLLVARNVLATERGAELGRMSTPSYFWTEQHGRSLHVVGDPGSADRIEVDGTLDGPSLLVDYYAGSVLTGSLSVARPRDFRERQRALRAR